ncbi:hypothetical protein AMS68_000956 [Peltaster fructicola]|uniref:Protein phosphatase n=1 Tax=Peltaster fructicola TaxID=286661 RepID=A0A6H0XLD3_9PEZI|nr:hypothetical protein AMS68_000956 [Peltaster fructicola]
MLVRSPIRTGVRLSKQGSIFLLLSHNFHHAALRRKREERSREPDTGLTTPTEEGAHTKSRSPFYFEAGYACWAKRPSRAFPPPFFSPPSGSFSDPLSTTDRSRDRRPKVNGDEIRGITNGDDALLVSENLLATNDGVGAWAKKERGHAPLWSRLIVHFMGMAAEKDGYGAKEEGKEPDPIQYLEDAYEATKEALAPPTEWFGTTTVTAAVLHWRSDNTEHPILYVSQLGDSKGLVVRPSEKKVIFGTEEQWHYFDCPRQLGTNSPDTPKGNAVLSVVEVEEGDIVLTMSDGVTDNMWEYEIADKVVEALDKWKANSEHDADTPLAEAMKYVAQQLVLSARQIAEDPFAESPFMERAVEEGLAIEGGKPDDISVVAGLVQRKKV